MYIVQHQRTICIVSSNFNNLGIKYMVIFNFAEGRRHAEGCTKCWKEQVKKVEIKVKSKSKM